MIRKATKNNYRIYYKEYFGIDFNSNYCVHHLDSNRENNDISNLLLLPKDVHHRFHFTSRVFKDAVRIIDPSLKNIGPFCSCYEVEMFEIYLNSIIEIQKWIGYKTTDYRLHRIEGITLTRYEK